MRVVKDRRSSLRVAIDAEVVIYTERDAVEATALDLGMGGLRAQSAWPVRTRRLVVLEVFVRGERVRLDAELLREDEVEQGHELAFRFVDVEPMVVQQLERVIMARLRDGAPRGYAQAFAQGVLGEPPQARAQPAPASSAPPAGGVPQVVPVISGLTQAIAVDSPVVAVEGTVVAPAPQPGREYTQVLEPEQVGVHFDDSWDDDDVDTAQFRRITDDVGPGHTLRMGRDGKPLPPETTAAYSPVEPSPEPAQAVAEPIEPAADLVEAITEPKAPVPGAAEAVPESVVPDATMALEGARARDDAGPPTVQLPFAARMVRIAAEQASAQAQAIGEEQEATREEKARARPPAPLESPPSPPPLLRGEVIVPSSVEAGVPSPAPRRPSQVALDQARAMLRTRPSAAPPRGPRVIVTIPHRTYRRAGRRARRR